MRFKEYIEEASYEGNIGIMELVKFYETASKDEVAELKSLMAKKRFKEAWEYFQKVLGVKLK